MDERAPYEAAPYSPMAATAAAVELYQSAKNYVGVGDVEARRLAEICYVINALAGMIGCPGNMSVEDFRVERMGRTTTPPS